MLETRKLDPLDLFALIAGAVIVVQAASLAPGAGPIAFTGIGVLSGGMVLASLLTIILLSSILVLLAVLSLAPDLLPSWHRARCRPLPLVIGAELIILGLASINLSGSLAIGTSYPVLPMGIELFSLGTISVASFVKDMGPSCWCQNVPNYAYLLFFLSLLPAALFIGA